MIDHYKLKAVETDKEFLLKGGECIVGRHQDCDIVIKEGSFSRQHAKLKVEIDGVTLEDLDSANGTFVNNRQVSSQVTLKPGDVIKFASTQFCLVSTTDNHATVLMSKLEVANQNQKSSIVIRDGFAQSNETVIQQYFPLPPGWSEYQEDNFDDEDEGPQCSPDVIDYLIAEKLPDAQSVASAVVVVISGINKSRVVGLLKNQDTQQWTVGRSTACNLPVGDVSISEHHATIVASSDGWKIEDNQSTNGLKVNGIKHQSGALKDGDTFVVGSVSMVFRLVANQQ